MGLSELYGVLRIAPVRDQTTPNHVADFFRDNTATLPRATEAERLVVKRVVEDVLRGALLKYWRRKCCVTGLDVTELLRASHIKPWRTVRQR